MKAVAFPISSPAAEAESSLAGGKAARGHSSLPALSNDDSPPVCLHVAGVRNKQNRRSVRAGAPPVASLEAVILLRSRQEPLTKAETFTCLPNSKNWDL